MRLHSVKNLQAYVYIVMQAVYITATQFEIFIHHKYFLPRTTTI